MDDHAKHIVDTLSITGVVATLAGWLPAIAALFSLIWSIIRIYETKTMQKFLGKYKGE